MPRKYIRTSNRGIYGKHSIAHAVPAMKSGNLSFRGAAKAKQYNIPKSTLERHVNGKVKHDATETKSLGAAPCLPLEVEVKIATHILTLEKYGFGLQTMEARQLVYDYCTLNGISHVFNTQMKCAGYDWLIGFQKRHNISLRKPEALSLQRSIGMNRPKVAKYQETLRNVLIENDLLSSPSATYNCDETGLTNVHNPLRILGLKGKREIHATTSGEKGTTTTILGCCSAAGEYIPPFISFKGVRKSEALVRGAPPGSQVEMSQNGWIDKDIFLKWIQHFQKHRRTNEDGKTLLILDGHASHLTLDILKYTQQNNIILLCLPSHCTHYLQPLDKTVYKSLKTSWNKVCSLFMRENPDLIFVKFFPRPTPNQQLWKTQ